MDHIDAFYQTQRKTFVRFSIILRTADTNPNVGCVKIIVPPTIKAEHLSRGSEYQYKYKFC